MFGVFAVQSTLAGMQVSGMDQPILWLRPLAATLIGPLFYLHLRAIEEPTFQLTPRSGLHLLGPVAMILTRLAIPDGPHLDAIILTSLSAYALLITRTLHPSAPGQQKWQRIVLIWMIAMILADLILLFEMTGLDTLDQSLGMLVIASSLLIFLAYILLTSLHQDGPLSWIATRLRTTPTDPGLRPRLDAHMHNARPWLDPELTLARLARQLSVPQRQISELINDHRGTSVSRWINSFRITEAQRLMHAAPKRALVELMLDAGFQTKSNFNKAFKDETGETPSAWRKANCG